MEKSTETKIIEAKIVSLGTATELTLGGGGFYMESQISVRPTT